MSPLPTIKELESDPAKQKGQSYKKGCIFLPSDTLDRRSVCVYFIYVYLFPTRAVDTPYPSSSGPLPEA